MKFIIPGGMTIMPLRIISCCSNQAPNTVKLPQRTPLIRLWEPGMLRSQMNIPGDKIVDHGH